ncbi:hypothetical protein PP175_11560 [Aneurinibacillus sp. Ricciae_BoGa-3]|uniref:hypothetical protein n=1 Tax=Aneurinibacillus sp. Ricciae_BoGa-3 TaxID=3022697 RepID=UPI002340849C|nr:hypothetical protein [Aneurinibacillus sp. Ricciae_BoGa-3]WCK56488.1 hypothetical protein PP175_11560 [Aneurinibacillus sp. Ricciae_BoGa-3]
MRLIAEQLSTPMLAANVYDKVATHSLTSDVIKEYSGLRVGVIGLTYPFVDQTIPPAFFEDMYFTLGLEEVAQSVQFLRVEEKVNIIILISHMGMPLDAKLASVVQGVDIILSGHSHDRVDRAIIVKDTTIIQSGASASFLG